MLIQKHSKSYPKRGEIFVTDLNPGFGSEIRKRRPVVIISSDTQNKVFTATIIAPFSSIIPKFIGPDVVYVEKQKGLNKNSVILTSQIRAIDKIRLIENRYSG